MHTLDNSLRPPYGIVGKLWLKCQVAVLGAGAFIFIGSLVLSPEWPFGRRLLGALLLPAMLEVAVCSLCAFMAFRLWQVGRLIAKAKK
jgi:hypothetical protein